MIGRDMAAAWLAVASAGLIFALGALHLVYTFCSDRFSPRDGELEQRMRSVSPVLTRQTTMWRAWIGFNASHSLGAMLFGLVYGYLGLRQPALLFGSPLLSLTGFAVLLSWLVLARRYWFRTPLAGIALATAAYAGALGLAWSV
jgi:hypothetical protein